MSDELLTTPEAAALLRLGPATLNRWRKEGRGPGYTTLGRKLFYEREVLTQWLFEQRRQPQPIPLATPPVDRDTAIYALHSDGLTLTQIAGRLAQRGILTANGTPLAGSTIRRVLSYRGLKPN
jgi:Helix-turn-helix domain